MTSPFAPTRRLIGAAFLVDFAVGVASLGVTELGVLLKASPFLLGLMGTVGSAAYTLGCLFSGRLSDRYGRRRCVVACTLIVSGVWLVVGHVDRPTQILLLVPFSGLGLSLFWPPLQAWLAELTQGGRHELNRTLGLFNMLWCAGLMLGPIACGYLWSAGHLLPFFAGIGAMVLVLTIALTAPRRRVSAAPGDPPDKREAPHPRAALFLHLAWAGNFASWFASGVIKSLFPKLGDDLGLAPSLVGWMIAAIHIAQLLIFWLARRTDRWQYRLWPMLCAQALALGGMLLAFCTGRPSLFFVAFAAVGVCAGVTYVGSLFYSLHGNADEKGGKAGLHEAVLGSGTLLGPLVGGYLANLTNMRTPFLLVAAVYAFATLAQVALWRRAAAPTADVEQRLAAEVKLRS
jgi:MFS family permease